MLRTRDGAIELDVQAVPRSSRNEVGKVHGDRLKLHVTAPPVDGEANAAVIELLAEVLDLPRQAITIVRGHTGKRKTIRIATEASLEQVRSALGLAGPSSTALVLLAAVGLATSLLGCQDSRELDVTVILPEDASDLDRADNASVVLSPGGTIGSFAVDGTDFELSIEREPDDEPRRLQLYLAEGEQLLAWGSTAPFSLSGPDVGLALVLGRPGELSTWPQDVTQMDAQLLASRAVGRGMLLLESDGDTSLLNEYTLELEVGAELPEPDLAPTDGGLFAAADGTVVRLGWETGSASAWRYDPSEDRWDELEVDASEMIGPRPGAATLVELDDSRIYLLGGGDRLDAVAIELVADADLRLGAAPVDDFELDTPRVGARALWLPRADDPIAGVLIVGGSSEAGASLPIARVVGSVTSFGPSHAWTDLACALVRSAEQTDAPNVVLCLGGTLDGVPTAAALEIDLPPDGAPTATLVESFLAAPLPDPMLFEDEFALYAQGESRWVRIDRGDIQPVEVETNALRARGGHSVTLGSGVTFVVGGVDGDAAALERWQVFYPNPVDPSR